MAYSAAAARQELLDDLARVVDEIGFALASLGAAYEQLDEVTGDRLEAELFRPVQTAYGRAQRAHSGFADRHGLPGRTFEQPEPGPPSTRPGGFVGEAVEGVRAADAALAGVQDGDTFIEVGDAELRAGLAEVREALAPLPGRAHELVRTLGR
jgi:hypothetical protein